jgi:hypothetical protein
LHKINLAIAQQCWHNNRSARHDHVDFDRHAVMPRNIERLKINVLRGAIRSNRISFPSQVPVFPKHDRADLQRKIVQLYFLFGWSCGRIGGRYSLGRQRVQQILNAWKRRAIQMGYLQPIPPARSVPGAVRTRAPKIAL